MILHAEGLDVPAWAPEDVEGVEMVPGQAECLAFEGARVQYDARQPATVEALLEALRRFHRLGYEAFFSGATAMPTLIAVKAVLAGMWLDGYHLAKCDALMRKCDCDCPRGYVWGQGYVVCARRACAMSRRVTKESSIKVLSRKVAPLPAPASQVAAMAPRSFVSSSIAVSVVGGGIAHADGLEPGPPFRVVHNGPHGRGDFVGIVDAKGGGKCEAVTRCQRLHQAPVRLRKARNEVLLMGILEHDDLPQGVNIRMPENFLAWFAPHQRGGAFRPSTFYD